TQSTDRRPVTCHSSAPHTRRRFGGRHPLCGIGVTSLMIVTWKPAAWRLRSADSRPAPGPFTITVTVRMPSSAAFRAAARAAPCAAKGVPFRAPLKPTAPALDHATVLPCGAVTVITVLLKVECTWTTPSDTVRFAFLRRAGAGASGAPGLAGVSSACFAMLSRLYPFDGACFLPAMALRGPLRVRALVCVR